MSGPGSAGAYGKIPAHGDFLAFGVAPDLREAWDGFVAAGLDAFRLRAGESWLEIYLTSPLWRFALGPGLLVDRPVGGVMMPSVDAVGRYFPFAVLADLDPAVSPAHLHCAAEEWFAAAEVLALDVLQDGFDAGALQGGLARLGLPTAVAAASTPSAQRFDSADDSRLWRTLAANGQQRYGLFWSTGSPRVPPSVVGVLDPPSAGLFAALLDGDWAAGGVATT